MGQAQAKKDNKSYVENINPSTEEKTSVFERQTMEEAENIVENAHEAFLNWRKTSLDERAKIIKKIGEEISNNKDQITKLMCEEMGKPIKVGEGEVDLCVGICNYTAENGPLELQDEHRDFSQGKAIITHQPIGVILGMQPWNFPLYQVIRYSIANIMAGNSTVFKHAEICWGTAGLIREIYESAGLPKDVFSVLYVDNDTIDCLIEHDKVRGVTLTGSSAAGKIVAEKAGACLKKTVLELGGSDAYLILKDADLETAVKACIQGRTQNSGQTCVAAKRFVVVKDVYEEFKEKFVEGMKQVNFGDPTNPDTDMGPLARKDLRDNLHEQVQESVRNGAKCILGGEIPDGKGFFYPATILENVKPDMPAYDDELFGPVASLIIAEDEEDAIRISNDHRYGLGGGIFSKDEDHAKEIARSKLDTGMVCINGYFASQPNLPFGGVKDSGYGREHGGFGMKEFVNIKTVMVGK